MVERRRVISALRARVSEPGFALLNPELVDPYQAVISDLEDYADFVETMARSHRSHYLERSSGQRNDDDARAMTRAVALGARAIFGELRCGTVAVVISVALRISINGKTGRNWCADL
jgi:hypothetical protein